MLEQVQRSLQARSNVNVSVKTIAIAGGAAAGGILVLIILFIIDIRSRTSIPCRKRPASTITPVTELPGYMMRGENPPVEDLAASPTKSPITESNYPTTHEYPAVPSSPITRERQPQAFITLMESNGRFPPRPTLHVVSLPEPMVDGIATNAAAVINTRATYQGVYTPRPVSNHSEPGTSPWAMMYGDRGSDRGSPGGSAVSRSTQPPFATVVEERPSSMVVSDGASSLALTTNHAGMGMIPRNPEMAMVQPLGTPYYTPLERENSDFGRR